MKLLDLLTTGSLLSAVVSCASSTVYTYSGINNEDDNTSQITKLQSFKELSYLLYDKLAIDDYLPIDESGVAALEKLSDGASASASAAADEYLRGDESNDNGHFIVLVKDEVSSSTSAPLEEFVPVFEIDQNAIDEVNEHQLLSLLLAKYPDLSITVNQNNVKVLSNINSDDNDKSSNNNGNEESGAAGFGLLNEKLHLFQQSSAFGGKTDNEKALFELKLLEMSLFPKKVFTVNNGDEKTFAIVTLKVSDDSRVKPALVQEAVATLVKQAYNYGIDATVIYTISNNQQQTSRKSIASAQFRRAEKDKKTKLSSKSSFASEEECIYSTNNCNTHGLCSKNSASNKWSCICASSFNKTTKATTHWSGSSCNKIDISAEFNLLFWSSLLIFVTVVGAVVLIFKMDQEPLPGILGAATSESFKN